MSKIIQNNNKLPYRRAFTISSGGLRFAKNVNLLLILDCHGQRGLLYAPPQESGQDFAPSQVENVTMRRFY
jgi:hypothetical protein